MADLLAAHVNKLKELEGGSIPYMYVDSEGKVTVGVGHNLTAHKDHKQLPFKVRRFERHPVKGGDRGVPITKNKRLGRAATQQEIQNDYDFLIKHKGLGKYNVKYGTLRKYTTLELEPTAIDSLFKTDLNSAISKVKRLLPAFAKFPAACRAALVDIQFNTGKLAKFPELLKAVRGVEKYRNKSESERWLVAAKESKRGKVDAARNTQVRLWFEEGAKQTAKARARH